MKQIIGLAQRSTFCYAVCNYLKRKKWMFSLNFHLDWDWKQIFSPWVSPINGSAHKMQDVYNWNFICQHNWRCWFLVKQPHLFSKQFEYIRWEDSSCFGYRALQISNSIQLISTTWGKAWVYPRMEIDSIMRTIHITISRRQGIRLNNPGDNIEFWLLRMVK